MSTAADYTAPSLMLPFPSGREAASLTVELCSTLLCQGRISDQVSFCDDVMRREKLSNTAMSPGWALPHARRADIPQLAFALGRTALPVEWFGGGPVTLIFLFAVPEAEAGAYMNLISSLARLSRDQERLQRLVDAPNNQTMFDVLQEIPLLRGRTADFDS